MLKQTLDEAGMLEQTIDEAGMGVKTDYRQGKDEC